MAVTIHVLVALEHVSLIAKFIVVAVEPLALKVVLLAVVGGLADKCLTNSLLGESIFKS